MRNTGLALVCLAVVDTIAMTAKKIAVADHPRAVAITNDHDGEDLDESAWVTLFFGKLRGEGLDEGRAGQVVEITLANGTVGATVELEPIEVGRLSAQAKWCSPNQLFAIAIAGERAYVAHVCGPKWTISRVPYEPSPEKNGSLVGENGAPSAPTGLRTQLRRRALPGLNYDAYKVAVERLINPDGGTPVSVGPERITCVLRDVGTWDATDPLEKKSDGTRAQGALGFNPPSLLGLATSAPSFHHGAAKTLRDVFSSRFAVHARAGNAGFLASGGVTPTEQQQLSDLVAFLESIDDDTRIFSASAGVDICDGY